MNWNTAFTSRKAHESTNYRQQTCQMKRLMKNTFIFTRIHQMAPPYTPLTIWFRQSWYLIRCNRNPKWLLMIVPYSDNLIDSFPLPSFLSFPFQFYNVSCKSIEHVSHNTVHGQKCQHQDIADYIMSDLNRVQWCTTCKASRVTKWLGFSVPLDAQKCHFREESSRQSIALVLTTTNKETKTLHTPEIQRRNGKNCSN